MRLILNEPEVDLKALADHLDDAGQDVELQNEFIMAHSDKGLGFKLYIDDHKFIVFRSYFPVKTEFQDGLDFCNRLNNDVFMGKFSVDDDFDIDVSYAMTISKGIRP